MRNTIPVVESKPVPCSEPQSFRTQQGYESNHPKGTSHGLFIFEFGGFWGAGLVSSVMIVL